MDQSVNPALPTSFATTDSTLGAAATAGDAPMKVSTTAQSAPSTAGKIADSVATNMLGPLWPTYWQKNVNPKVIGENISKAWEGFDKGGAQSVYAVVNTVYTVIDTISNITGPLATVTGILGYLRYLPFPPFPAVGAALTVFSNALQGVNFILDVTKLVLSGVRLAVSAYIAATNRDPDVRKAFTAKMKADAISFATNGFSVALGALTNKEFRGAFSKARLDNKSVLSSLGAGFKAQGTEALKNIRTFGSMPTAYREVYTDALDKAIVKRSQEVAVGTTVDGKFMGETVTTNTLTGGSAVTTRTGSTVDVSNTVNSAGSNVVVTTTTTTGGRQLVGAAAREVGTELGTGVGASAGGEIVKGSTGQAEEHYRDQAEGPAQAASGGGGGAAGAVQRSEAPSAAPAPARPAAPPAPASAVLGPAPTSASVGLGARISAAMEASTAALRASFAAWPTPLTTTPLPPASISAAPRQRQALAAQAKALSDTRADIGLQISAAKAGQAEAAGLAKMAEDHQQKALAGKAAAASASAQSAKDLGQVNKDAQKVAQAKAESAKGDKALGDIKGKGESGKGANPPRVSGDDLPWYKRWLNFIVERINSAKEAISNGMARIVLKAVEGATGMDNLDGQIGEAGQQVATQQATLAAEPAEFAAVGQAAGKEASDAAKGKQVAEARRAENVAAEATAKNAEGQVKAEEAQVKAELAKVDAEEAAYKATYGPALGELSVLADKRDAGDLSPNKFRLDAAVAELAASAESVRADMLRHKAAAEGAASEQTAKVAAEIGRHDEVAEPDRQSFLGELDGLKQQVMAKIAEAHAGREARLSAIVAEGQGLVGRDAVTELIAELGRIQGSLISVAQGFEQQAASELGQMHQSFTTWYGSVAQAIGSQAAAAA